MNRSLYAQIVVFTVGAIVLCVGIINFYDECNSSTLSFWGSELLLQSILQCFVGAVLLFAGETICSIRGDCSHLQFIVDLYDKQRENQNGYSL